MTRLGIPHTYSEYNGTHNDHIGERMERVVLYLHIIDCTIVAEQQFRG